MSRWDIAGYASALALVAGVGLLLWGLQYGDVGLVLLGSLGLGAGAGGASVIGYAWLAWHRAHGSWFCLIWQWRGHVVHHFHWPRERITGCNRSAGFAWRSAR